LGPWLSALLVEVGVTIAAGLHCKWSGEDLGLKQAIKPAVIWNGVMICAGTLGFTIGATYFNIGVVAALSKSTALIRSLLGVYMLKERLVPREVIAAGLMIVGIAALSF